MTFFLKKNEEGQYILQIHNSCKDFSVLPFFYPTPFFDSLMHPVNYVAKDALSTSCLHFTRAVIAGKLHPGYRVLRTESGFRAAGQQPAKLDTSSAFTYSPTATTCASHPLTASRCGDYRCAPLHSFSNCFITAT